MTGSVRRSRRPGTAFRPSGLHMRWRSSTRGRAEWRRQPQELGRRVQELELLVTGHRCAATPQGCPAVLALGVAGAAARLCSRLRSSYCYGSEQEEGPGASEHEERARAEGPGMSDPNKLIVNSL